MIPEFRKLQSARSPRGARAAHSQNRRIARLEREVARLSHLLAVRDDQSRDLDDRPAVSVLGEARGYFRSRHGQIIYPDELALSLGISVGTAVEVCAMLSQEGQIAEA